MNTASAALLEQYIREALTEAAALPQRFYHGSSKELKPGFVLGGKAKVIKEVEIRY